MVDSSAVYDLLVAVFRRRPISAQLRDRAFAVPVARWDRILALEGCAVHFARAMQLTDLADAAPPAVRRLLREATGTALERAVLVHRQCAQVSEVAAASGIRVLALKGAARLLAGELPGGRSIGDIDLLAAPADAARLHALLQRDLGYSVDGQAYPHHLAGLTRTGALGIEIHVRLAPTPLALDDEIWRDAVVVTAAGRAIEIPSATNRCLHTLEHAARVNWSARYRLRDIADLAAVFTTAVDMERVARHAAASDCRRPMGTLLGASRAVEPRISIGREDAWRTVRRVGRSRLALATIPRTPRIAERWFRYAGVLAEGSPRTIGWLGAGLVRRTIGALVPGLLAVAMMAITAACRDSAAPGALVVPPFAFAANSGGVWSLYRVRDGVTTLLSTPGSNDREPQSAAGRIVFTSLRDGNAEIYGAPVNPDFSLGEAVRLTDDFSTDAEPALSPSGATIAFVSSRGGAPRIWLMDATGANARPLDTGSPDYVPEGAPNWSPRGDRIAFTSARSGASQVYVVAAGGGTATQVSHETRGAYTPSWLPDGGTVVFMALSGDPAVLAAPASGGAAAVIARDPAGLGEPACNSSLCLAVGDPLGSAGRIVALTRDGRSTTIVLPHVADDHHPAFLRAQ